MPRNKYIFIIIILQCYDKINAVFNCSKPPEKYHKLLFFKICLLPVLVPYYYLQKTLLLNEENFKSRVILGGKN